MNTLLSGSPDSDTESQTSEVAERTSGKNIDGVFYPKEERMIDSYGFEQTKHAIHFHGKDWDIVLSTKRNDLTNAFVRAAAGGTREPEENIMNLRFIASADHLNVKFNVRHKSQTTATEIQKMLSKLGWEEVKGLYEPREKIKGGRPPRPLGGEYHRSSENRSKAKRLAGELSSFGRANVGPDGVRFERGKDYDEEPAPLEEPPLSRQSTNILVGIAV